MTPTFFSHVELFPPDPILSLPILFDADSREQKVNLGIGVYKDDQNVTPILASVRKAEEWLHSQELGKEYQPIEGKPEFIQAITKLIYGEVLPLNRIGAMQTLGGTGALRLGCDFLVRQGHHDIYLPDPSWANHSQISQNSGMQVQLYSYYKISTASFLQKEMFKIIEAIPSGSVLLLQAGCHNPTGMDLNKNQWQELSTIIKDRKLIPFFDLAYQGFGGGLEEDCWPIRYFASQDHEFFVANSFSKNMGLYGERVGALSWFMHDVESVSRILSQLKQMARASYSNPPLHGGRLVYTILNSKDLREDWVKELDQMRSSINEKRHLLKERLKAKLPDRNFDFLEDQHGMFSMIGFSPNQVDRLKKEYGIYITQSGRISIPGLTTNNVDYVANSFATVLSESL
jgi:aspartate/tyrosine/aromatic aminotransferase